MLSNITLRIQGMHCTSCACTIDFELEDLEGVREVKTHYAKQISTVIFETDTITHEKIIAVITALGYEAIVLEQE